MWFEDFQEGCHGGHLKYQNGTILALQNLHTASMPSTEFPLHPTYCSKADNNERLSRWPPWLLSEIWFWYRCRECEKILTDILMRDGQYPGVLTTEDFQDGCCGSHLGFCNKMVLAVLNLHVGPMPPTKFWLSLAYHSGVDEIRRISRWPPWGPS